MNPYSSVGLVLIGAAAALVPNLILEKVRTTNARRAKWDEKLLEYSASFAEAVREFLHKASPNRSAPLPEVDESHRRLRLDFERLRLLANAAVVEEAFAIRRHAYAVRQQYDGTSLKRPESYSEVSPTDAARDALERFASAVRVQLRVDSKRR